MISLPHITAEYCRANCAVWSQDLSFSKETLFKKPQSASNRRDMRQVLDLRIADNISGHFIYPPGGGIDWHDDSGCAGWRVYMAWSETGNSGMIFEEGGVRRVCQDKPGWNVRTFLAPTWHCVWTECWRYSIGLYLPCTP